jgi:Flp pilus assembly protein TadG
MQPTAAPVPAHAPAGERGQAAVSLIVILGLFLFACMGFAVDITNVLFHRQAARAAADAACEAGAMDLIEGNTVTTSTSKGFTVGTAADCVGTPGSTMCAYAAANGYSGAGLSSTASSNAVSWSFPSSVAGVSGAGSYPFLQVSIAENIRVFFMSLATGSHFQAINVRCTCGVVQVLGSAPMVVLHPSMAGAFYNAGVGIFIVGGPRRGLQVNSTSSTAVTGAAVIDLSKGGPSQTGSDVGLTGGPPASPGACQASVGFCGGTTGNWRSNVLPVPDPFGSVPAPAQPLAASASTSVAYQVDGCPDHRGCTEYYPGYYSSGIRLTGSTTTAIFRTGLYYMDGNLESTAGATLRNAKPTGWLATDGIVLYFHGGSINLSGNTGSIDTANIDSVPSTDMTCDGSTPSAALNMAATIPGNVLIGQCTQFGTYWDTAGDTTDSRGLIRGLVMFQAHANTSQPTMTGSGSLAFGGALYFHSTSFADVLKFSGNGTSGTYVIGQIVADQVTLSGNGSVYLALNGVATINTSKVTILP